MNSEAFYILTLQRLGYFHMAEMKLLLEKAGSAQVLFEHKNDVRAVLPECNRSIVEAFRQCDEAMKRAEVELEFTQQHNIKCLTIGDNNYPQRLQECDDAPLALFYLGNADLNKLHIVSIVGTRRCTQYGKDVTEKFVRELKELCPDVLVVSGLAYGIDIAAHRASLSCGLETIGVLAHGLDTLYPAAHRTTAKQMVHQGGLLTEHFQQTKADKMNFLRRNRIVAGIADATVVIESKYRGGSLSTARIANDYNREVFAVPGRLGDEYSEGCNKLIARNKAQIFTDASDFVQWMGWDYGKQLDKARKEGIQPDLFPILSPECQKIADVLKDNNDLQINILSVQSGISIPELSSLLFDLEMEGIVKALPGGIYHLNLH
ncbi:MAG: DNA-protecting protein DprA [Prevotella sp.]|nr:DNA-protecting protein DprA [Prevotella sp.]